jgi:hypothetical protein
VVDREAVLEAVRAARVLGDVAADRADLLARRVGRVEDPSASTAARDVEVRDPGLDHDALALEVDLEDPVHPRDETTIPSRRAGAAERPVRAPRATKDALARAEPQHPGRLPRAGKDDEPAARATREPSQS